MLNKDQYLILRYIKAYKVTDPISYTDVLNAPLYKGRSNPEITNYHLEFLSEFGYIETRDHHQPYHLGHSGYLTLTPAGYSSIQSYEEDRKGKRLTLVVAIIAAIFAAIAAIPTIADVIQSFAMKIK